MSIDSANTGPVRKKRNVNTELLCVVPTLMIITLYADGPVSRRSSGKTATLCLNR